MEIGKIKKILIIISYFLSSRDDKTGLNAPLYNHENATGSETEFNQDWAVSYW